MLTYWQAPHSYTGEDLVELCVHGHPAVVDALVRALGDAGFEAAEPGEFTYRAVANGKLDLLSAEALGEQMRSESGRPPNVAALRATWGGLAAEIHAARVSLDARIDFDELRIENVELREGTHRGEVDDVSQFSILNSQFKAWRALADTWVAGYASVRRRADGPQVVLVGRTNVGKSSLFNALVGEARALVHGGRGTTRDPVEATLWLGGHALRLVDTAGLHAASGVKSGDPKGRPYGSSVDAMAVRESRRRLAQADVVVVLTRADRPLSPGELRLLQGIDPVRRVWIASQSDRLDGRPCPLSLDEYRPLAVSARLGEGLDELRTCLGNKILELADPSGDGLFSERQVAEMSLVRDALDAAIAAEAEGSADERIAEALREASVALDRLMGMSMSDRVVEDIFARFCIGK